MHKYTLTKLKKKNYAKNYYIIGICTTEHKSQKAELSISMKYV